ncbi:hypothetical protein FA95DRAFT_551176 [Auriscalpium vulgare]|uniref:Uncharacterized protein n=1 Tax=Auriscalpium vulgare TaxID=40419 RepID=A0ACB8S3V3_9AGAM|nr:hypothetical protein FA95DRAFT_551176 [Auriscalpium vulgare]
MGNVRSRQAQRHHTQPPNEASSLLCRQSSYMNTSSTLIVNEPANDIKHNDQLHHLAHSVPSCPCHYFHQLFLHPCQEPERISPEHSEISSSTLTALGRDATSCCDTEHSDLECSEATACGNSNRAASLSETAQILFSRPGSFTPSDPPDLLTRVLFKAMGYSNCVNSNSEFYPHTEFVIYLEFIEDKARGNANRTHPAASLYEAAHHFFSRSALPPAFTPSFPRNLVTPVFSEPLRYTVYAGHNLSFMCQTHLAELLFDSLGLKGFGPCPSTEFVILLEFVAAQVMGSALTRWEPAESLVGAVYHFLFRRAASVSMELPPRSPALNSEDMARSGERQLLQLVGRHPDLTEASPRMLARALYRSIGLETDPSPTLPDPASAIHAEFLDDQRHYTPDRAVPAKTLSDAAFNYLRRRSLRFPIMSAVSQEAEQWRDQRGKPATLAYQGCV